MNILWYMDWYGEDELKTVIEDGIYFREEDIKFQESTIYSCLSYHLKINHSKFTAKELVFLSELIETQDKSNLVIAYWLITNKEDEKEI